MVISKCTLYGYVKVDGTWRYCKAAYHDNGKIKPDIVFVKVKQALLEKLGCGACNAPKTLVLPFRYKLPVSGARRRRSTRSLSSNPHSKKQPFG